MCMWQPEATPGVILQEPPIFLGDRISYWPATELNKPLLSIKDPFSSISMVMENELRLSSNNPGKI